VQVMGLSLGESTELSTIRVGELDRKVGACDRFEVYEGGGEIERALDDRPRALLMDATRLIAV
jgi:hypothetical protein